MLSQRFGSLLLPAAVILLSILATLWVDAWQWSYAEIIDGQSWRLVTGHFTHGNLWHLLWNGLAFVLLTGFASPSMRTYFGGAAFLGLCLWVGVAIFWWLPTVGIYRGLSGVLHGWTVLCIVSSMGWAWRFKTALLILLGLKLGWDFLAPAAMPIYLGGLNGTVLPAAHAFGALGGVVLAGGGTLFSYLRQKRLRGIR